MPMVQAPVLQTTGLQVTTKNIKVNKGNNKITHFCGDYQFRTKRKQNRMVNGVAVAIPNQDQTSLPLWIDPC